MAASLTDEVHIPSTALGKEQWKRLIVVLENSGLEIVKVGSKYTLLNSDDHGDFIKKYNKDANDARPDITHQCLLTLLDSPLNKAGLLQVFISTARGVLIEVHPSTRIPRTFKRFSGLMVQLLHDLRVRATNGQTLLNVVKNPVTDHLPVGVRKIGLEVTGKRVKLPDYAASLPSDQAVVFVVGAIANGNIEVDYVEEQITVSDYPLSASVVCGKVCDAFEAAWGIY